MYHGKRHAGAATGNLPASQGNINSEHSHQKLWRCSYVMCFKCGLQYKWTVFTDDHVQYMQFQA